MRSSITKKQSKEFEPITLHVEITTVKELHAVYKAFGGMMSTDGMDTYEKLEPLVTRFPLKKKESK